MTFRNEVLEGIGAFGAMRQALKTSGSDDYYRYMMQRQQAMDDEDAAAVAAGQNGNEYDGTKVTSAGSARIPRTGLGTGGAGARMPGVRSNPWGMSPTPAQAGGMVNLTGLGTRYSQGGVVRSFEFGGMAESPEQAAASAADDIILESLAESGERGATAGMRRSGGRPVPTTRGNLPMPSMRRGVLPAQGAEQPEPFVEQNEPWSRLDPPDKRDAQYDNIGQSDSAAVSDSDFAQRPVIETRPRKGQADSAAVSDSDVAQRPAIETRPRATTRGGDYNAEQNLGDAPPRDPTMRERSAASRRSIAVSPDSGGADETPGVPVPPLPLGDNDPRGDWYNSEAAMGPLPARDATMREASAQVNAERARQRYIGPTTDAPSDASVDYPLPSTQAAGANNTDNGPLPARDATDADRRAEWNSRRKPPASADQRDELADIPREQRTSVLDRQQSDTPVGNEIARLEGLILENQTKIIGSKLDVFSKTTAGERAKIDQQNATLEDDNNRMRERIQMLKRNSGTHSWNKPTPPADQPKAAVNTGAGGNAYTRFQKPDTNSSLAAGSTPEGYAMNPTLPRAPSTPSRPAPTPGVAPPNPGPTGAGGQSTPGGMAGRTPAPPPGAQPETSLPGEDGFAAAQRRGIVDANGQVIQPGSGAINTQPVTQQVSRPGMDAQGGTGLNPQGSNQGMSTNNVSKDLEGVLVSATQAAQAAGMTPQQMASGQGAIRPDTAQQILQRYDGGGTKMSPGNRMLGGMLELYKLRLRRGDTQGAAQLALGIVQFANVQAATHGQEALALLQAGNTQGAAQQFIKGHDWMMDGVTLRMAPNGQSVLATDLQGKTQQLPLDGRWLFAASKGLANGTLLWNALNQHVASLSKPDLNARNRELNAQLTEERIKALRLKNAGGGGQAGMSYADWMKMLTGATAPAQTPQVAQGSDDGVMTGNDPYAMAE